MTQETSFAPSISCVATPEDRSRGAHRKTVGANPPHLEEPGAFISRWAVSRWLENRGIPLNRQLAIVQWALPLLLSAIVFVDETLEHLIHKREPFFSESFLTEVVFFGILGPVAVWMVLRWIRAEWHAREQAQAVLQATYYQLVQAQAHLKELHRQRGELLNRVLSVQEAERRRLAREIHDELGQLLTGLSLNLRYCLESVPEELTSVRERLTYLNGLVQQTIEQAHEIIVDLRPVALDEYGLVPALEEELEKRLSPAGIEYRIQVEGEPGCLPADHALVVFRIVQEAITNVLRHAHAHQVNITLCCDATQCQVLIEDDGVGISQAQQPSVYRGVGILGMQERAAALGGTVAVRPRYPKGTRVEVCIPLSRAEGYQKEGS